MENFTHNNIKYLLTLGFVFVVILSLCVPQISFAQNPVTPEMLDQINREAAETEARAREINANLTEAERQAQLQAARESLARNPPLSQAGNPGAGKKDKPKGGMDVFETIGRWIGTLLLSIASMFVYVGGTTLDIALTKVVFGMGDLVNRSGFGNSIDTMWKLIRDICNLAFIFAFVFLGIRTIISPDSSSVKRTLAQIIIGALLINFSLFFVKFVIDFSNLTAYHIYNAMISGSGSLSAKIADVLGIVTFFSNRDPNTFANISGAWGMIWFYILAALVLFIAAFVFIAAAILLVIRFVALILIMIASPILFAATLFPQTAQYSSNLWRQLISYSLFAPVYLLLTLVTITLMQGLGTEISPGGSGFVDAVKNPANGGLDSMGVILNFVIIIFFLIQSFMIAKKIGVAGGDTAVSIGQNLRARGQRYMGNATMGLAAATGRATVGKVASRIAADKDGKLKDAASTSWFAKQKLKASHVIADSSFDARNVGGIGKKLGVGEGRKGGYNSAQKEIQEKEEEFKKTLGEVDDTDVRVQARKQEWEHAKRVLNASKQQLQQQIKNAPAGSSQALALQAQLDALEKGVSDKEIAYGKEKQRRIIGSSYAEPSKNKAMLDQKKNTINDPNYGLKRQLDDAWANYVQLPDAQKTPAARSQIDALQKQLSATQKDYDDLMLSSVNDMGYAGKLQKSSPLTAWVRGRMVSHEKEVGKAMRKAAEKGLPKEK